MKRVANFVRAPTTVLWRKTAIHGQQRPADWLTGGPDLVFRAWKF
jgi:hypothetical protein